MTGRAGVIRIGMGEWLQGQAVYPTGKVDDGFAGSLLAFYGFRLWEGPDRTATGPI